MLFQLGLPVVFVVAQYASAQTVYLAGDSTMAKGGGGSGTEGKLARFYPAYVELIVVLHSGWGQFLGQFLTIPVVNDAVAGTSARSYSDLGFFATLINKVEKSDYVIIEFGHNDATSGAIDNGQQDAVGDGYNITEIVTVAK